jgi:Rrf2 family cysteine metabolism transcriptional repressor
MVQITPKKNQHALRAVFKLSKHQGRGPTQTSLIADSQAIPARFLEVILQGKRRQSPPRASQTKQGHRL